MVAIQFGEAQAPLATLRMRRKPTGVTRGTELQRAVLLWSPDMVAVDVQPENLMQWPWASYILAQFPQNPTRQFQQLFCLWLAVQLARNLSAHARFLTWFDTSGLELSRKRGLGAHPSKLYGLVSPPRLSAAQLRMVGSALIFCLLAACAPVVPRVFLFLAYLLSLCYFPQLFAEVTCSGHSTILIPSILFILSCSSSLDHEVCCEISFHTLPHHAAMRVREPIAFRAFSGSVAL